MVKFFPPPFFQGGGGGKFLKILMVLVLLDKTIHEAFRIHESIDKTPKLEKFFIFTIYKTLAWKKKKNRYRSLKSTFKKEK